MSNADKSQEIAKQAGEAAKKAGKVIGAGLSKFSRKMVAGAKGFKEGLKDADEPKVENKDENIPAQDDSLEGEVVDVEEVKTTPQVDYSLDEE